MSGVQAGDRPRRKGMCLGFRRVALLDGLAETCARARQCVCQGICKVLRVAWDGHRGRHVRVRACAAAAQLERIGASCALRTCQRASWRCWVKASEKMHEAEGVSREARFATPACVVLQTLAAAAVVTRAGQPVAARAPPRAAVCVALCAERSEAAAWCVASPRTACLQCARHVLCVQQQLSWVSGAVYSCDALEVDCASGASARM